MHILIVAPTFFPANDVGIFRMTTLADYLLGKDEKVTVIRDGGLSLHDKENPYRNLSNIDEIPVSVSGGFYGACKAYRKTIIDICDAEKIDIIIYTCAPYYAMKISYEVYTQVKVPYIIDIRDFWLKDQEELFYVRMIQRFIYPIKYYYQNRAFKTAEKIVVVSSSMKKRYLKLYKKYDSKFYIVCNGFDDQRQSEEYFNFHEEYPQIDGFDGIKIGFAGAMCLYSKKYANEMFKALDLLNRQHIKVRLYHMGRPEMDIYEIIKKEHYDSQIYQYLGYLPNERCIEILKRMDMNAIVAFRYLGLGTKVFDYLYVKKPILYVGKSNTELAKFLKYGICENVDDIVSSILDIKDISFVNKKVEMYTRKKQNSRYYELIKSINNYYMNLN